MSIDDFLHKEDLEGLALRILLEKQRGSIINNADERIKLQMEPAQAKVIAEQRSKDGASAIFRDTDGQPAIPYVFDPESMNELHRQTWLQLVPLLNQAAQIAKATDWSGIIPDDALEKLIKTHKLRAIPGGLRDNARLQAGRFYQIKFLYESILPNSYLIISSLYRSAEHNASLERSAKNSKHIQANAMDICVARNILLDRWLLYGICHIIIQKGFISYYNNCVHVDEEKRPHRPMIYSYCYKDQTSWWPIVSAIHEWRALLGDDIAIQTQRWRS